MTEETDSVLVDKRHLSLPTFDNNVDLELLEAWPLKCAYAVQEIFKTEVDYIDSLNDLIQGYKNPLSGHLKSDNEGHRIISTLFCNIDQLYDIHKLLLEHLKSHQSDPHAFGRVFVSYEENFKVYSEYCINYDAAITCLQDLTTGSKDLEVFIFKCQDSLGHSLPLSSQLIKPVQRIMRYHIMLKEVVKNFDRNHYGYQSLQNAYRVMVQIGDFINEAKKQKENAKRILDIQSSMKGWTGKDVKNLSAYGELIIEESCKVGSKGIERQVLLFDKLLLILKKKDEKTYTYKGHIVANELHIDRKFCGTNPTMFRVSSLVHRHQSYVVDVGSAFKHQNWLNRMHALIHQTIDQAKKGRVLASPKQQVKRRKIEQIDGRSDQAKKESSSLRTGPRFKAGRILNTKKRPRSDVRELFPDDESTAIKLKSYTLKSPVTSESSILPIPEHQELQPPIPEITKQWQEPISDLDSSQGSKTAPKHMSTSTSMDSLVSLTDVDIGVEECDTPADEVDGSMEQETRKSKLSRRAAIKVKKTKTFHGLSSSGSYSTLIKMRANEAREASRSPPSLSQDKSYSETHSDEGDSMISQSSLQNVPSLRDDLPISQEQDSSLYEEKVAEGFPVDQSVSEWSNGPSMMQNDDMEAEASSMEVPFQGSHSTEELEHRTSPIKRPRSLSHEAGVVSEEDQSVEVEIVIAEGEDDGLELGESCGQAKLRGRNKMPSSNPDFSSGEVIDLESSGASGGFLEQSASSYSGGNGYNEVEDAQVVREGEGAFMILEDSSDSEEEEEDEDYSLEDLELTANELQSSLLEAAEMGELDLQEDKANAVTSADLQTVPQDSTIQQPWLPGGQDKQTNENMTEFFTNLNRSVSPSEDADEVADVQPPPVPKSTPPPVFKFKAAQHKQTVDLYGTLPHKKKATPATKDQRASNSPQRKISSGGRRADGFSRLLEFTRQQVVQEPVDSLGIDVCQSLPVLAQHSLLDDIKEDDNMHFPENGGERTGIENFDTIENNIMEVENEGRQLGIGEHIIQTASSKNKENQSVIASDISTGDRYTEHHIIVSDTEMEQAGISEGLDARLGTEKEQPGISEGFDARHNTEESDHTDNEENGMKDNDTEHLLSDVTQDEVRAEDGEVGSKDDELKAGEDDELKAEDGDICGVKAAPLMDQEVISLVTNTLEKGNGVSVVHKEHSEEPADEDIASLTKVGDDEVMRLTSASPADKINNIQHTESSLREGVSPRNRSMFMRVVYWSALVQNRVYSLLPSRSGFIALGIAVLASVIFYGYTRL